MCWCTLQMTAMTAIYTQPALVPKLAQENLPALTALNASSLSYRTMKPTGAVPALHVGLL